MRAIPRRSWWVLLLAGVLTLLVAGPVSAKALKGHKGFETALKRSQYSGKPIALFVYTDWCPYCAKFDKYLLSNNRVRSYLGDILYVRLNPEKSNQARMIADNLGVTGYPSFFMVTDGGQSAHRISGYTMKGNQWVLMKPGEFITAMKGVARPAQAAAATRTTKARAPSHNPPKAAAAEEAPPANPVTLYLTNGRIVEGDLVKETDTEVEVGWSFGTALFDKAAIERIERGIPTE